MNIVLLLRYVHNQASPSPHTTVGSAHEVHIGHKTWHVDKDELLTKRNILEPENFQSIPTALAVPKQPGHSIPGTLNCITYTPDTSRLEN